MSKQNNFPEQNENDVSQYYPSDETYNDFDDVFYNYDKEQREKKGFKVTKFTSSQLILLAVIFVVYTALIFTASWLIFYRPSQPSEIPFETEDVTGAFAESVTPPLDNKDPVGEETGKVNADENAYVAKEGVYNILVVGRDSAATLADVTMIVNMDTVNKSVSVMQIPRDTLVNIGVPTNKVNAAYSTYVGNAYRSGAENTHLAALEEYISLFEKNLCIEIHHGAVVNLEAFITIVDLFGGVDVYVPRGMYYNDPEQNLYISIGSGMQHLDGYNSMCFVRFRSDYVQADLGRVNAQKIFMTAFLEKVKNSVSLTNLGLISDVANAVFENVVTDMTVSDIIYYGKALIGMELGNVNMLTLPGNLDMWSSYYVMNKAAALDAVNRYFNIYKKTIPESIFDKSHVFCDDSSTSISNIYYGSAEDVLDGVYNAEEIDNESIYIPNING
ncbi:MAG: LytR family transcriptional regulator [Ruminococcaceae bacterium]|nr:LytR family transcriptional regulator [Oscillospiraceae bacterium]